jgi:DNA-binding response OmpR family regulator
MKIAIIEDEMKLANSLKEGLEMEGYTVSNFYDGSTAEAALKNSHFDLALLDLALPKKNGLDVCRSVRKSGSVLPILILTANDTLDSKIKALDGGADDFVAKPFSFDELLARMRALLRRSGKTEPVLKIGDLVLDPQTRLVQRAGKNIILTSREFGLLQYLLQNVNQVKSREEIFRALWGRSERDFGNVLDVHIRHLREKIDDEHPKKIIRTVRGLGYSATQ